MYNDLALLIAVGDLIIVGLKCQPYMETSYAIVVSALIVNILEYLYSDTTMFHTALVFLLLI
jgi:hypothetical protein